jgi:hypothetical protein
LTLKRSKSTKEDLMKQRIREVARTTTARALALGLVAAATAAGVAWADPCSCSALPGGWCTPVVQAWTYPNSSPTPQYDFLYHGVGTWQVEWSWGIQWDCPTPPAGFCGLCIRVDADRWSDGLLQPGNSPSYVRKCNFGYSQSFDSIYPSGDLPPLVAGDRWDVILMVATFDPQVAVDCTGQAYRRLTNFSFLVPPDPS